MENYPVIDESGNVRSAAVVEDYLVHITGNVTPEEEDILLNVKKLYFKMKSFDHIDLSFDAKMQVAEQDYFDLGKSIFKFCLRFREDTRAGSQERVLQWKTLRAKIEKNFKEFRQRKYLEKHVGQVEDGEPAIICSGFPQYLIECQGYIY